MKRFNQYFISVLVCSSLILFSGTVFSLETDRALTITLHASDKESVDIGQITFTAKDDGLKYLKNT